MHSWHIVIINGSSLNERIILNFWKPKYLIFALWSNKKHHLPHKPTFIRYPFKSQRRFLEIDQPETRIDNAGHGC